MRVPLRYPLYRPSTPTKRHVILSIHSLTATHGEQ
jgi:hypothetical protein